MVHGPVKYKLYVCYFFKFCELILNYYRDVFERYLIYKLPLNF